MIWSILKTLNLPKIGKKSYKNIDIYYVEYTTIKGISDCNSSNTANSLYFIIGQVDEHIEEKMEINT